MAADRSDIMKSSTSSTSPPVPHPGRVLSIDDILGKKPALSTPDVSFHRNHDTNDVLKMCSYEALNLKKTDRSTAKVDKLSDILSEETLHHSSDDDNDEGDSNHVAGFQGPRSPAGIHQDEVYNLHHVGSPGQLAQGVGCLGLLGPSLGIPTYPPRPASPPGQHNLKCGESGDLLTQQSWAAFSQSLINRHLYGLNGEYNPH